MDIIFYLITYFKIDSSPKYIPFIYNLNKLLGSTLLIITSLIILWIIYRIYKFLRFFYQYSINGKKIDACKGLTYDECELTILRQAVDEAEKIKGTRQMSSTELKTIIDIVESF